MTGFKPRLSLRNIGRKAEAIGLPRSEMTLRNVRNFVGALILTLSACGTTPEERGLSGAGIGAGAGALLGAITGLTVVEGALIGAGVGGLTGAITNESQVNLGKPAWKTGAGRDAALARVSNADAVRSIQAGLNELGYAPGGVDGVAGWRTRSAIRQYQRDYCLSMAFHPRHWLRIFKGTAKSIELLALGLKVVQRWSGTVAGH